MITQRRELQWPRMRRFVFLAMCLPAFCWQDRPRPEVIEIMELSGWREMIAQMPAMVESQIAAQTARVPITRRARVESLNRELLTDLFEPVPVYTSLGRAFDRRYDEKLGAAALESLRSPLGRKVR